MKGFAVNSDTQGDAAFYRGDYKAARSAYEQAALAAAKAKDREKMLIPKMNLARVSIAEGGRKPPSRIYALPSSRPIVSI